MAKKGQTTDPTGEVDPEEDPKTEPSTQPEENYKARFQGLQRKFDKTQKELTSLQEKYDTILEDAESSKQSERQRQIELDALQKEMETAKAELDKTTGELTAQEANVKRAMVIMADFPELAKFEAEGLLPPAATSEEMTEKFTAFQNALKTTVEAGVQQKVRGTSTGDTGGTTLTTVRSAEAVYADLVRLGGARDDESRAKYNAALAEWDEIQAKKLSQ
jgi:chromosome segregation ATPase